MAGIYIHIPFCKKACTYCDFHFSTSLKQKGELVKAIVREAENRIKYLKDESVKTIYFGGGTPSLLNSEEIDEIINSLFSLFSINSDAEITLEANPDDLSEMKLKELKNSRINRLSIGIQSFIDSNLKWMNRSHDVQQAKTSIKTAQNIGFDNISVDLIYGIPGLNMQQWENNLQQVFDLNIQHLSAYCLTVEPGTALGHLVKTNKVKPIDQDQAALQFEKLIALSSENGFTQYEVSNFAKPEFQSRHNGSYWRSEKYLGLGPSAHSFNGHSRQWNIANNNRYIKGIQTNSPVYSKEEISPRDAVNEYLMTGLRTTAGVDLQILKSKFNVDLEYIYAGMIADLIEKEIAIKKGTMFSLTTKGLLMADKISSDLFILEDDLLI